MTFSDQSKQDHGFVKSVPLSVPSSALTEKSASASTGRGQGACRMLKPMQQVQTLPSPPWAVIHLLPLSGCCPAAQAGIEK